MIRIIALELVLSLTLESIQGFGVTSVDDTTTTTPPPPPTTTTTTTANIADGSTAGVGECFIASGDCASCCGACTETTDLDNGLDNPAKDSCVCYEASTAPTSAFLGTEKNDCVFIEADDVENIFVRNQCLDFRRGGSARPAAERKSMLGTH